MAGGESWRLEMRWRGFALLAFLIFLGSCAQHVVPPAPPAPQPPPPPANAVAAGVAPGPELPALSTDQAQRAWTAFRASCPALMRRTDGSGLTRAEDWRPLCEAEPPSDPARPPARVDGEPAGEQRAVARGQREREPDEAAAGERAQRQPALPRHRLHEPGRQRVAVAEPERPGEQAAAGDELGAARVADDDRG